MQSQHSVPASAGSQRYDLDAAMREILEAEDVQSDCSGSEQDCKRRRVTNPEPPERSGAMLRRRTEAHSGGTAKRARTEASDAELAGAAFVAARFGWDWGTRMHTSHKAYLAKPFLYCRVCGAHGQSFAHTIQLKQPCQGRPADGSIRASRLLKLNSGEHPKHAKVAIGRPVPLRAQAL